MERHQIDGYIFLKEQGKNTMLQYSSDLEQNLPCGGPPKYLNTLIGYLLRQNGSQQAREKLLNGQEYHDGYMAIFPYRDQNDPEVIQFKQKFEESRGKSPEGPIWLIGNGLDPHEHILLPEGTMRRIVEWFDSTLDKD